VPLKRVEDGVKYLAISMICLGTYVALLLLPLLLPEEFNMLYILYYQSKRFMECAVQMPSHGVMCIPSFIKVIQAITHVLGFTSEI
jgi:hypothetical protein